MILRTAVALLLGYALGAIPTGVLIGRLWGHPHLHERGSHHTGATNVGRVTHSLPAALLTGLGDALLAALAVLLARLISPWPWAPALAGVAAIAGHNWSIFVGMRGGIGLATLAGGMTAQGFLPALAMGACFGLVWYALRRLMRHPARATSIAIWTVPVAALALRLDWAMVASAALGALVVTVKSSGDWHRRYAPSTQSASRSTG